MTSNHGIAIPPGLTTRLAIEALRGGGLVRIEAPDGDVIHIVAIEALSDANAAPLFMSGERLPIILSAERGAALGFAGNIQNGILFAKLPLQSRWTELHAMVVPQPSPLPPLESHPINVSLATAALRLAKYAQLIPALLIVPPTYNEIIPIVATSNAIADYDRDRAASISVISEAIVPLAENGAAKIMAFRAAIGGPEHLAIIIGDADKQPNPLIRLHSACLTGDLFGSLRCDCGEQLLGALRIFAENDAGGILLYLAQEGRGIGLANKLRAYQLQDQGFDTHAANEQLGFAADERDYTIAIAMLKTLGLGAVRLLSNNPLKQTALEQGGIMVTERVAHSFPPNAHNARYLADKSARFEKTE